MKRNARILSLLLLVGLLAGACGDDGGSTSSSASGSTGGTGGASGSAQAATTTTLTPKQGGVLTFGVYGETPGLDPVVANGSGTTGGHEMSAVYDTLMRWNPTTQQYEPRIAQSLVANADASEWTLKLKPNIKFTDGTALDADAVKYNIGRHTTYSSRAAGLVARIKETTVVDPLTVKFTLTTPWGGFPYVLSYTPGMIGSPTAMKACGDTKPASCAYNLAPVGAGPFQIDSFKPKEAITLKKNAAYYGGAPYLDGLKFVYLDSGREKTYAALQTGTLNAGFLRQPEMIKKAKADGIEGYTALNWLGGLVLINNGVSVKCSGGKPEPACTGKADGTAVPTTPPTTDKRVRQAVAFATNPDTLNQRLWNGAGFAGTEFFQKSSRFSTGTPGTTYDLAKAKALVDEVKKEGKWDGSIRVSCYNGNPQFGQTMQAMLEAAGFKVTRKDDQDIAGLINDIQVKKDYDLACWGFNVYEDDPFINLNQNLQSKSAGNWIGYANPEVDKLLDQAVAAKTDAELKTAFDGIAKIWNADVPSVIFEATGEMVAWRKDVHGIEVTVTNTALFDKAWIG